MEIASSVLNTKEGEHNMAGNNQETRLQKITPFLWFNDNAEEAVKFYTSIFKNSKVGIVTRYGEAGPGPKGSVMTPGFQIGGPEFVALNGGAGLPVSPPLPLVSSSGDPGR